MRALLDTNAFLWSNIEPGRLSATAKTFIKRGDNELFLSAVVVWEVAIKYAKGHLRLPENPDEYVSRRIFLDRLQSLRIDTVHALRAGSLLPIHRDPFDRLLVAQSQLENLPILTSDARIAAYGVEVIW